MTDKCWLAEGVADDDTATAKRTGAQIIGRAFAHEYDATGEFIAIANFGLGLTIGQIAVAIHAGAELLGG